jgi:hypothetical protein
MTAMRRGNPRSHAYVPTSPQIQPLVKTRSCGKCGKFVETRGGSKLRIIGWICQPCTDKRTERQE